MTVGITLDCVAASRTKALPEARNERLRGLVRNVVANRFGGNATAAAAAFGVSQSLVSDFLSRKRGAGLKLIEGLASFLKVAPGALAFSDEIVIGDGTDVVVEPIERYPNFQACSSG